MSQPDTLDVTQFLQGLRCSRYHLRILIVCSLVTLFDGQDFAALAYALPYIRDDMHISDEMTGYVSSAAFLGQMIGSLLGSHVGDVLGRRPVIVVCTIGSAILTFAVGFAASPEQLIALRFVSGLAIGGLLAPCLGAQRRKHASRDSGDERHDNHDGIFLRHRLGGPHCQLDGTGFGMGGNLLGLRHHDWRVRTDSVLHAA
nr:MFS transporter [Altererythrobacter segetis]